MLLKVVKMRKINKQLLVAVAAMALTSGKVSAASFAFTFTGSDGTVARGLLNETGGIATAGSGTITSPGLAVHTQNIYLLPGGPSVFSYRFGGGTDLIADNILNPVNNPYLTYNGLDFNVGSPTYDTSHNGVGFNLWGNGPNNYYTGFLAGPTSSSSTPGNGILYYSKDGSFVLTQTPIPAALFFVGPALAGIFGFVRLKPSNATAA